MPKEEKFFEIGPKELRDDFVGSVLLFSVHEALIDVWAKGISPRVQDAIVFGVGLLAICINRWRNRRHHVRGKVESGDVAVWVFELQGDDNKGTLRSRVADSLERAFGDNIRIRRAGKELAAKQKGNYEEDYEKSNRKAKEFLAKHQGYVSIWGEVLLEKTGVKVSFTSNHSDAKAGWTATYRNSELPIEFWQRSGLVPISAVAAGEKVLETFKAAYAQTEEGHAQQGNQDPFAGLSSSFNEIGKGFWWLLSSGGTAVSSGGTAMTATVESVIAAIAEMLGSLRLPF
jgi:hypothetical protein